MGHYDSCREADNRRDREERELKINNEFDRMSTKLTTEDKEFLINIFKEKDKFLGMIDLIQRFMK
jgi:hypothetical protein